jgi:hypothetical protein
MLVIPLVAIGARLETFMAWWFRLGVSCSRDACHLFARGPVDSAACSWAGLGGGFVCRDGDAGRRTAGLWCLHTHDCLEACVTWAHRVAAGVYIEPCSGRQVAPASRQNLQCPTCVDEKCKLLENVVCFLCKLLENAVCFLRCAHRRTRGGA